MSLSFVTRSNRARLTEVANTTANGEQIGVRYTLALDDQRTEAVEESGAKWQYGYDSLKQLVTAKKTDTQASVLPPLDQSYAYDPMGNRRTYADQTGSTAYAANSANQYTAVGGVASVYDHNGHLLTDGVKNYTWDAENQLTSVTPVIPTEGSAKVEYTYDWRMRRKDKKSYIYTAGNWVLSKTSGFKYHEWNLINETVTDFTTPSSPLATAKQYVWGNDLSGNLHGAGGVGGLLSMKYNGESYFYAYDGNGNVRALVKADAANPAASGVVERYAYDGFGRELPSSTPIAARLSPFAFSTKYLESETGMNYYGYRFYAANVGRWINRDPIMEKGGGNVYEGMFNNIIGFIDFNGLLPSWLELKDSAIPCVKKFTVYIDYDGDDGLRAMFSEALSKTYSTKGSGLKCPCTQKCHDGISIEVEVARRKKAPAVPGEQPNSISILWSKYGSPNSNGDNITFIKSQIGSYNGDNFTINQAKVNQWLKTVVPHEFGHSFGLKHPHAGEYPRLKDGTKDPREYDDGDFKNDAMGRGTALNPKDFNKIFCDTK